MIPVQTTEFNAARRARTAFESNMFSRTNAFALLDETGRIRVDTAYFRPGGLRVSRVQSTGHLVDLTEETAVTVLMPAAGQLRVRVAAAEYKISPKAVCIFGPNARRTRAVAPRPAGLFHANAVLIPQADSQALVDPIHERTGRWPGLADGLPVSASLPHARRRADLLGYVTRQFDDAVPLSDRAGAAMAVLIEELLAELVRQTMPALAEGRVLPAALQRVRMAEEIMRARSDAPLSMAEVAREVGVGLRSLELAFVAVRAMGPRDVLLRMRLERARARLMTALPSDSVTTIALDCGFTHLGRFPAAYRMAFGELPAETLARARRKAG